MLYDQRSLVVPCRPRRITLCQLPTRAASTTSQSRAMGRIDRGMSRVCILSAIESRPRAWSTSLRSAASSPAATTPAPRIGSALRSFRSSQLMASSDGLVRASARAP